MKTKFLNGTITFTAENAADFGELDCRGQMLFEEGMFYDMLREAYVEWGKKCGGENPKMRKVRRELMCQKAKEYIGNLGHLDSQELGRRYA